MVDEYDDDKMMKYLKDKILSQVNSETLCDELDDTIRNEVNGSSLYDDCVYEVLRDYLSKEDYDKLCDLDDFSLFVSDELKMGW